MWCFGSPAENHTFAQARHTTMMSAYQHISEQDLYHSTAVKIWYLKCIAHLEIDNTLAPMRQAHEYLRTPLLTHCSISQPLCTSFFQMGQVHQHCRGCRNNGEKGFGCIPPPRMMTPVLRGGAFIASSFIARMSAMMSSISPGFLKVWKYSISPSEPSVNAGQ